MKPASAVSRRVRRHAAALVAVALAGAAVPRAGLADASAVLSSKLPTPRYGTSTVWDGRYAFIFGGVQSQPTDQIVRYDSVTGGVQILSGRLPSSRWSTSAVFDGSRYAYVFGGSRVPLASQVDEIVRFDTTTGAVDVLPGRLPTSRWGTSAVWTGSVAYVFGGRQDNISKADIVRFDPATGLAATVGSLPAPRFGTSAVWDGTYAYILGGDGSSGAVRDIVRYRPAIGEVMTLGMKLPVAKRYTSAVWDGVRAHIFGDAFSATNEQIVRFTPYNGLVEVAAATLPSQREYTSAIWDGSTVLLFGGTGPGTILDQIVRYSLEPGAPQGLTALRGPGKGQITLNWYPPKDSAGVSGYRIYGGATSGARALLAEIGPATTWTESGLANGQTRFYVVKAVNGFGEGGTSTEASNAAPVPPGAPRELRAVPDSIGRVSLAWRAPETFGGIPLKPFAGYRVYRNGTSLGTTSSLAYSDFGCRLGNVCTYVVAAVNEAGQGPNSNDALMLGTAL
jgi:hypothetical protein